MTKRGFDFVVSFGALLVIWPLFLAIAAVIKLADGGAVFFRQERVGRCGRPFRIWKFRTMREGADRAGPSITKAGDHRVTGPGRWLRRTKLDELPQLFNVLCGEMSFVGPRPEVPKYVALYTPEQRRILDLRPGITDLATIEFRNEEQMLANADDTERYYREYCLPRKVELNLRYAEQASVWADIRLICRTVLLLCWSRSGGVE